jgi:hypothetical protein
MQKPGSSKRLLIACLLIGGIVLGVIWNSPPVRMLTSKILFYGEVVDQHGQPVADAKVEYYNHDLKSMMGRGSNGVVRTAADGKFKVRGVRGSSLSVVASKEGYDHASDLGDGVGSARNFDFGFAQDRGRRYMDPRSPSKLTLIKKGELEPLILGEVRYEQLHPNGEVLRVYLDQSGEGHAVDFLLDVDPVAVPLGGSDARYTWSVVIRAPQGQVFEQTGLGYEAPQEGYKNEVRLGYDKSQLGDGWRPVAANQTIFVRFEGGTHAFLKISLSAESRKNCLYLESWLNMKPGSRQLAPGKETEIRRKVELIPRSTAK